MSGCLTAWLSTSAQPITTVRGLIDGSFPYTTRPFALTKPTLESPTSSWSHCPPVSPKETLGSSTALWSFASGSGIRISSPPMSAIVAIECSVTG